MTSAVEPRPDQIAAFSALPAHETIHMLNLLRFREVADYPTDHPDHGKRVSGRAAYGTYGTAVEAHLARVGARVVWTGRPDCVLIGPTDERWDAALIVEYPGGEAFLRMVMDPGYIDIARHRTAALADSRLVRMKPVTMSQLLAGT